MKFCRFIFFILSSSIFVACENDIEKVNFYAGKKNIPVESMYDAEIIYSDSGIVTGKLKAKKLDHYTNKHSFTVMPKGIIVEFFDHHQTVETKLTANYAMKYDDKDVMEAKGNVIIINEKGEQLNTEHIVWSQKKEQINSDAFVKITTKTEILMGDGLESNQTFSKYKIKKIRGVIQLKEPLN
jgi:LPS export ABC transporter protein LptC